MPEVNWQELWQKLMILLRKPLISLKYRFHKFTGGIFSRLQLPWFKLVVLALLTFMILKKDMQFQVNMKSPLAMGSDDRDASSSTYQQSSLAQPMSWKERVNPFAPAAPETLKQKQTKAYINRYSKVAKAEMEKYGIPASIKMAQALIESRAGESTLAKKNNNHFGIKCFSKQCKKGHCSNFNDDHHKDFFRKFESPWESWRLHSKVLQGKRYQKLKSYGRDYKKWAVGLRKAGYATDKRYDKKLISIIERHQLYRLDK
ncbi:MAG: glucosaminidase domain-containing protein, partial [Bacteroidota bacterium]